MNQPQGNRLSGRPIIFGEVLFDQFEDGAAVLGGAPFNVAWHLQGLGLAPLFISRVGSDAYGRRVMGMMQDWGMDVGGLQVDDEYPTGTVQVKLCEGQPEFTILPDQAYDHIERDAALHAAGGEPCSLIYHGSLVARAAVSQQTLQALCADTMLPKFVDINLRAPWWNAAQVRDLLHNTTWVKFNDAELAALSGREQIPQAELADAAAAFRRQYNLELLIVTLGDQGAFMVTPTTVVNGAPVQAVKLMDTVGAGDSFSAVTILGLIQGWPLERILDRALEFAAAVCGIRGATTDRRDFYRTYLEKWQHG